MKKFILIMLIGSVFTVAKSQVHLNPDTIIISNILNTSVKLLASDSLCSTFLIVIPGEVKLHYHAFHSENVLVTEGNGIMKLGEKEFEIREGDLIVIPRGTKHSVKSLGKNPLKVLSIQSPNFDGKDRVMVD